MRLGVFRTVHFGSALRYLRRSEVHDCLAQLDKIPAKPAGSDFMPLKDFCRLKGVSIVKILTEWRSGHLVGLLRRTEGQGLHQIWISSHAMCNAQSVELLGDLTLLEAAKYLRINLTSIHKLRDAGLLKQIQKRNPDTNHQRSYISCDSILHFEKRFATLGQVSKRFAIAPIHLARHFDRDGIVSAKCLQGQVRVYEWDHIPNNIEATT